MQVDVVVVDRDGAPVRALKGADFALLDRGKPQAIASFDEVSHERSRPASPMASGAIGVTKDVSNNQSAQSGRLIVMVIDDLHIYRERTDRAREIARKVLAALAPQSSMAVLFTSGEKSTLVTQDPAVLAEAVETLKGRQSWRRPHPAIDTQRAAIVSADAPMEVKFAAIQKAQDAKLQHFFDNLTQYKTLQDAARLLGQGDVRRKAFVLISEGIGKELSGLFGVMAPAGSIRQSSPGYSTGDASGPTLTAPTGYHDSALIDMMESLRRSNVATYAIDPRGRVDSKDLARECFPPPAPEKDDARTWEDPCSNGLTDWVSAVRQAQHGLEIVAEASGGFAVTNTDDFTSGIGRIVDDLDHYYLLGFYPADTKGKNYRPLDVKIPGHPEWTLRFRRGYLPGGPPPPKNATEMVALSSGVLPKGDLPLRLASAALPGSGSTSRVWFVLEVSVPRRTLQDADGRLRDTLKYEVLVVDEKRKKVRSAGGLEARLTLSAAEQRGLAPDQAIYQVADVLDLEPGRYEIRVSATSARVGKGGSVYLPVEVPDFRAAPIALGGLALGYAEGGRVPLAPRAPAPAQRAARVATPVSDPRPAVPFPLTLDRDFTTADTLRVYAEGLVRDGARLVATVELVNAAGHAVRSPSPSFSVSRGVKLLADVPLQGLAAGRYVLRVRLSAAAHDAVREVPLTIR